MQFLRATDSRSDTAAIDRWGPALQAEFVKAGALVKADTTYIEPDAFAAYIDYLRHFLETGEPLYRQLLAGSLRKRYRQEHLDPEQQAEKRLEMLEEIRKRTLVILKPALSETSLDRLGTFFEELRVSMAARANKLVRVLLIGDCLYQDILSFTEEPCIEDDVEIHASFIDTKNPIEARQRVLAHQEEFQAVFYSPLTYEQSLSFRQIMEWRNAAMGSEATKAMLDESLAEVDAMVRLLAERLECPIFVHNTAGIRRHEGSARERVKNALTLPLRRRARDAANAGIAEIVARNRAAGSGHVHLLDETQLLKDEDEESLGRYLCQARLDHPAVFGARLAPLYRDRMYALAHLINRKLIVCDLDNTIWQGVIGEGDVRPYHDRQATLMRLRERGILLAINSKNDPAKVRFEGTQLSLADFVNVQINWNSKVDNMRRIQQTLNLRLNDFVFVDDQSDQREMVRLSMPEVHLVDATNERHWRLLEVWAQLLDERPDVDRTLMYRQRQQREQSVKIEGHENPAELLAQLGIRIDIREAKRSDLRRAAELVNRTNQFNTCGSRITVAEMTQWLLDGSRRILLVDASDKFGSNGTIAVMVLERSGEALRIPCFVLSCRVFGYGIEHAVINYVKRMRGENREQPIVGLFTPTPHNDPCKDVYPHNGFAWDGTAWIYSDQQTPSDPSWLTVNYN